ncbi:MAG: prolyl-tRNA synthetase associated domain-containing protein [Acidobacteria bacterium]|nr:MAG: prolyl-tRNA synthetase associated domain-containing protein [Acidobacteriota bacterium]
MTTPEELLEFLVSLGIRTKTYQHAPVFTVEESKRLRGDLPGGHCKSLFLRDKKRQLFLVVALEHRKIDLKSLRRSLGAHKNLSFGSPELMMEALGVAPGAVTPFAVINDTEQRVQVVLDRAMLDVDLLNYHPLENDRTTAIAPGDLLRFLEASDHAPRLLEF